MQETSFHNPRYWHMRAEVTRVLAVDIPHLEAKTVMLRIADDYDLLVRLAEEWRDRERH